LIRVGEMHVLVDAGLPLRLLRERFEAARLPHNAIDHLLVTHGHLDHSRSAGALAKRHEATVHCAEKIMRNRALCRATRLRALRIGEEFEIESERGERLHYRPVLLPHDCDPTVAFRLRQGERVAVILTDMGHPRAEVARALSGAHHLVLEFNYDETMLANGPYPEKLRARVAGDRGHLSNQQAAEMLALLAGPQLETLVLAHLSEKNNTPTLARELAQETLARLGLAHVQVHVASQHEIGPNLKV
jgi:phosphoribosyl 1,2-cyclic phosphodiesterase